MGEPVLQKIWDINARFNSDPAAYETGGVEKDAYPVGYWVDITDLALRYGWERVEASPNWTTYYQGARFNQFILRSGLTWKDAMLELYPVEVFITPTPALPTHPDAHAHHPAAEDQYTHPDPPVRPVRPPIVPTWTPAP